MTVNEIVEQLAKLGVEIYPHRFDRRHTVSELVGAHGPKTHDELEAERPDTVTSGRILAMLVVHGVCVSGGIVLLLKLFGGPEVR